MSLSRLLSFIFLLYLSVPSWAEECDSTIVTWGDYHKTLATMTSYYDQMEFNSVEDSLYCLLHTRHVFASGRNGPMAVEGFFARIFPISNATDTKPESLDTWEKTIPDSPWTFFARLRLKYIDALGLDAIDQQDSIDASGANLSPKKLRETEKAILSADNALRETPVSYGLLLSVAMSAGDSGVSSEKVFAYGIRHWPDYYSFYQQLLTKLVPTKGGSWEDVDHFINFWTDTLEPVEKRTTYARLYHSVQVDTQVLPLKTLADWGKMKESLIDLYSKYPAEEHFVLAASYACIYEDKDFYREMVTNYGIEESEFWLGESSRASCDNFFDLDEDDSFFSFF